MRELYPGVFVKDPTVETDRLSMSIRAALTPIRDVFERYGVTMVLTSAAEDLPWHARKSKHYAKNNPSKSGEAVDIRVTQDPELNREIAIAIRRELPDGYFVINHTRGSSHREYYDNGVYTIEDPKTALHFHVDWRG